MESETEEQPNRNLLSATPPVELSDLDALIRTSDSYRMDGLSAKALHVLEQVAVAHPYCAEVFNRLGMAFMEAGNSSQAIASFERALFLDRSLKEAACNLAGALVEDGRPDLAIFHLQNVLVAAPNSLMINRTAPEVFNNLGNSLVQIRAWEKAETAFREAVRLGRNLAEVRNSYAVHLLRCGSYRPGWLEWEFRKSLSTITRNEISRRWNGEMAAGASLLICSEQGIGDMVHFFRYVVILRQRTKARMILECHWELERLLTQSVSDGIDVVSREKRKTVPEAHDFYFPLLSAPLLLGIDPPLPWSGPYLRVSQEECSQWKARLKKEMICVGICWKGNPEHPRDRFRSIPLQMFHPLLQCSGVAFYSLQVSASNEERSMLTDAGACDDTGLLTDCAATAALITELDLVISVDTSAAHLAGALGRPVWILLDQAPDWRWGIESNNSIWYPSCRLFRQEKNQGWPVVLESIKESLMKMARR